MSIFQMHGGQTTGQRGVVKLWIVMRTRDGANVHEAPHELTSFAYVEGLQITYPPEQATLL
jgi:hypothetical protein